MKNGLYNFIRGIAFCFLLSIICLFGRVEAKADTYTGVDLWQMFEKHSGLNWSDDNTPGSYLDGLANMYSDERCNNFMYLIAYDSTREIYHLKIDFSYGKQAEPDYVYQFCQSRNYKYLGGNYFLDNNNYLCTISADHNISTYTTVSGRISVVKNSNGWSWTTNPYTSNSNQCDFTVMLAKPSYSLSSSYDSTLGYLKNCVVKRGTTSPKDWKSYSEFFTHNMDYFSWDSLTTTSREVKKVEYKLYFYNGNSVVHKENSFIESSRAGTYATSKTVFWNTFTDINWKDILIDKNAHYEIWFRPCDGNLYGDWCYFDISLPSWLTRFLNSYNENDGDILSCFLYWIENGLDILGDGYYDLGQCTYAEKQGNYEPSENLDTNHSFSNVVNSYVVNYIDNSDNSVDDVTNIIESLPPSTNSYTEIYNNITVIQNGNEDGNSLINKFGDLLSFCKNFLTFIYNFINLILSPLSFLPGWLKSLLSMSIIAFIVICVIKTLRG